MDTLLDFSFRLTFVLLMINGVFLAAQATGVYNTQLVGSEEWQGAVVSAYQKLGSVNENSIFASGDKEYGEEEELKEREQTIGALLYNLLFGYHTLLKQIFPAELGWIADIISAPLMLLQGFTLFWFGVQFWNKIKPF